MQEVYEILFTIKAAEESKKLSETQVNELKLSQQSIEMNLVEINRLNKEVLQWEAKAEDLNFELT